MKRRTKIACLILFVLWMVCHGEGGFSQGEFNNWFFGNKAAITFNTNPPTSIPSTLMNSIVATVSVSDSNGLVLFYSNGYLVCDRNHGAMSYLVWGLNSSQPVFAFKKPGENNLYWIFSLKDPSGIPPSNMGLFSSVIDMTLNGGLGGVIPSQKNIPVPGATLALDKLTGTRHHNNRDAWVVTRDANDHFLSYHVSPGGIAGPVISASTAETFISIRSGDIKISQDGKKMVANYGNLVNSETNYVAEFCSFNSQTGSIVPLFKFNPEVEPGFTGLPKWAEFSPNSQLLYIGVVMNDPQNVAKFGIFQYDATRTDLAGFMDSQYFLGSVDGPYGVRGLQMAPDGKIYCCLNNADVLSMINYPNIPGPGCGFQLNGLNLNGKLCTEGLPQFLQKYKAYIHGTETACQGALIKFNSDIWPPADTIRWDFGDPAAGGANVSSLPSPDHIYANPGTYTVTLYVRHNDNRTDTTRKPINILQSPQPDLGPDIPLCLNQNIILDAGSCNGCTYQWSDLPTGQTNIGTGQTYTATAAGTYMVTVSNPAGCTGRDIVTVFPGQPVTVDIDITASTLNACQGSTVTCTATATNPGNAPVYQWKVNGIPAGTNSPIFTFIPINGDQVQCMLTSSMTDCISNNPATSNTISMVVYPGLPASVAIATNTSPFCPGTLVSFTASPTNGGPTAAYQWKVNGVDAGTNAPVFTYNPVSGDVVTCLLTSSLQCVSGNPAVSNPLTMNGFPTPPVSMSVCFDSVTTVGAKPFKLRGGLPLGGTWSGPGVNALTATFDPAAAGTGLKTIVYSYTNVYLCSASKTKSITVQSNAVFSCGNTLTDIRDNKSYPTVQIGKQCWMAANLNRGSKIISSQVQFDNCTDEKYCFGNDEAKCSTYGGLYQWDEMMRYDDTPAGQGLCPPGWHIPTESDWTILLNFYQGASRAGKPLQDSLMAGFRTRTSGVFYLNSSWSFADFAVLFWTSSSWGSYKALSHGMNSINFSVSLYPSSRANALPVRCLRD